MKLQNYIAWLAYLQLVATAKGQNQTQIQIKCTVALEGVPRVMNETEAGEFRDIWKHAFDITWPYTRYNFVLDGVHLLSQTFEEYEVYTSSERRGRLLRDDARRLGGRRSRNTAATTNDGSCNECSFDDLEAEKLEVDGSRRHLQEGNNASTYWDEIGANHTENYHIWRTLVATIAIDLARTGMEAFQGLESVSVSCEGQSAVSAAVPEPCCSNDLATCRTNDEYCSANAENCEGPCNSAWLPYGPSPDPDACIPLWAQCGTGVSCCGEADVGSACVEHNPWWSQCLFLEDEEPQAEEPSTETSNAPETGTSNAPSTGTSNGCCSYDLKTCAGNDPYCDTSVEICEGSDPGFCNGYWLPNGAASDDCIVNDGQCGMAHHPDCCGTDVGAVCAEFNPWYSQCLHPKNFAQHDYDPDAN